jgi:hypothetical protein
MLFHIGSWVGATYIVRAASLERAHELILCLELSNHENDYNSCVDFNLEPEGPEEILMFRYKETSS